MRSGGVYRALDQLLQAAGHGAISRTQVAAGVGESYLRDVRARLAAGREQGYDLGILLRMLDALAVDRRTFFGRLLGLWLYKLGDLEAAIRMQQRAVEYLAADEHHSRFAALHGLGVYNRELTNLETAQDCAARARELAPHVGPWLVSNLRWLDARIALDQRRLEDAERLLRETIKSLTAISAEAAALATTELVRVLLLQDRRKVAHETAKTMTQFIIPLEEKSLTAAAAALDLVHSGQAGQGFAPKVLAYRPPRSGAGTSGRRDRSER